MSQISVMLLPMSAMILLTFAVMAWMLKLRYKAVREDGVNPRYFKLNRGAKIPDYLVQVTQHFDNLLEMPILFYIAMLLLAVLHVSDLGYIFLAWAFFLSRLLHIYIHTTYNKLKHRRNIFIISTLILVVLWMRITLEIISL